MFSIVIPSCNRIEELLNCLNRLNSQTYSKFEVIVVDDYSSKPIVESVTLDSYQFSLSVIRNESNMGAAMSRNIGVDNSNYDWIMFLDDDDIFLDNKCDFIKTAIETSSAKFIYHSARINMIHEGVSYVTCPEKNPNNITQSGLLRSNLIGGTPMWCISKDLFKRLGGFCDSLKALEDYEFVIRLLKEVDAGELYYIDVPLTHCHYVTKRASVSKNVTNTRNALEYLYSTHYRLNQHEFNKFSNEHLAHTYLMSLNRLSSYYYFLSFWCDKNLVSLAKSALTFLSPYYAIKLRKFI